MEQERRRGSGGRKGVFVFAVQFLLFAPPSQLMSRTSTSPPNRGAPPEACCVTSAVLPVVLARDYRAAPGGAVDCFRWQFKRCGEGIAMLARLFGMHCPEAIIFSIFREALCAWKRLDIPPQQRRWSERAQASTRDKGPNTIRSMGWALLVKPPLSQVTLMSRGEC